MSTVFEPSLLELHETQESAATSPVRADGLVPIVIIRPGLGRGKGRHYYPGKMLQEAVAQGRFKGWPMFIDHQATEVKRKLGGLPRSTRDLGGVIRQAWWDPTLPADSKKGHEQGAVMGLAKPNRFMRDLIEDIPEAVGASISSNATGVQPMQYAGQTAWLVEGIQDRGSVDWVTAAGAGGRVLLTMESLSESDDDDDDLEREVYEAMDDPTMLAYLREHRPELAALLEADDGDDDDLDGDAKEKLAQLVRKHTRKGLTPSMAKKAARKELDGMSETRHEGGTVKISVEDLEEALETEEGAALLGQAIDRRFAQVFVPKLGELIEAGIADALEDERELMQSESDASARRLLQVRDLRDVAHRVIAESELPTTMQRELFEAYDIVDEKPTAKLNVVEVKEGDTVAKSAEQVLREALEADIGRKREQVAELSPRPRTRVSGQGATKGSEATERTGGGANEDGKAAVEEGEKTPASTGSLKADHVLQEAGIEADPSLWAGILS